MSSEESGHPQGVRLQKALAELGLGSRRRLEEWIVAGRVRVNGHQAQLGDRVVRSDKVTVDGKPVRLAREELKRRRIIAYHKPEGEVVTRRDPEGRTTIFQHLPGIRDGRWIAIGRLDINTAGLLLLTNDGDLANALMHPSRAVEREYAVRVQGPVDDSVLHRLTHGVQLEDGEARFEDIVPSGGSGQNQWFHVVLCEGRNREVRRLWEAAGCTVSRLKRVRFGNVILGARPRPREWRELTEEEETGLLQLAGLPAPRPPRARGPGGGRESAPAGARPGSRTGGRVKAPGGAGNNRHQTRGPRGPARSR
ncbi:MULTISPECIES: pseudouridine synthase [Thiorhodovibrio]|uniref:pseudouridine synthase n=1 Tax=Thiorhodovibrio TaxID=61593 RepID=UPI0019148494|nr:MULTISPECIES: pseudouridine synthase [Thiorhodovibrio]MBK5968243.1 23S rRNA pseudouridylate synthase B [Thiorhodovibrio winogradskyi]WPL14797.1 Ribosomal large subunit pseudouridine synthase B [Thiorhodovibrio litoralis]